MDSCKKAHRFISVHLFQSSTAAKSHYVQCLIQKHAECPLPALNAALYTRLHAMTAWSSLAHSMFTQCFNLSKSAMHIRHTFSCSILAVKCSVSFAMHRISNSNNWKRMKGILVINFYIRFHCTADSGYSLLEKTLFWMTSQLPHHSVSWRTTLITSSFGNAVLRVRVYFCVFHLLGVLRWSMPK